MNDYKSQYEEYKKSILRNYWFIKTLREKYRGSISAEEDYIDRNGVLWKIGGLGAVCGFCIGCFPSENGNWILGVILFIAIICSIIWAMLIGTKFKKDSGEVNFYAFLYHKHFKDHIQEEKNREFREFEQNLSNTVSFINRCANDPCNNLTGVVAEFQKALSYVEELEKKYKQISRYDLLVESLKDDYEFNVEIQKDIDKCI